MKISHEMARGGCPDSTLRAFLLCNGESTDYMLTLPMLRLRSSIGQESTDVWKPSKPCHIGIHWVALTECSQMSTHVPGFQSFFFRFLHHVVLATLATRNIRVNLWTPRSVRNHLTTMIIFFRPEHLNTLKWEMLTRTKLQPFSNDICMQDSFQYYFENSRNLDNIRHGVPKAWKC